MLAIVPVLQLNNYSQYKKQLRPPSLKNRKIIEPNFDEDELDFWDFLMQKSKGRSTFCSTTVNSDQPMCKI